MKPNCIITGCDIACFNFTQHGDLWELGDVYIFNACGEPDYEMGLSSALILQVADHDHATYFERRNVYIIAKADATLNQAALDYLGRSA